jgi:hypothetical protein
MWARAKNESDIQSLRASVLLTWFFFGIDLSKGFTQCFYGEFSGDLSEITTGAFVGGSQMGMRG